MTGARHLKAGQYTKAGPQVCVHRCTLSPSVYVVIGELVLILIPLLFPNYAQVLTLTNQ